MTQSESNHGEAVAVKKPAALPRPKLVPVDYYAPEANTVAVAGDFNGWDPQAHNLKKSKAGWWKTSLKLAPGRYQYRFVINGEQWSEDPENPDKQANEFSSYNSILDVR